MLEIALTAVAVALGIVGYFLKQLHNDFKTVTATIVDIDKRLAVQEERAISAAMLSGQKLKELEDRIEKLEKRRYYKPKNEQ